MFSLFKSIPESLWLQIKEKFIVLLKKVKVGKPNEPTSFLSSVIDKASYTRITGYIERAKNSKEVEVIGGLFTDKDGYIYPTIIICQNPHYETFENEFFLDSILGKFQNLMINECLKIIFDKIIFKKKIKKKEVIKKIMKTFEFI
jgi:hypothetical protein